MKYVQAFESLGYDLDAPRTDWTAERADAVCITLWKRQIDWAALRMDTRLHGPRPEHWSSKPGNKKRVRHAQRALSEFDGWVDAILVSGIPGEGYEDAAPWIASERKGKRWRVTFLDPQVGHIALEAQ